MVERGGGTIKDIIKGPRLYEKVKYNMVFYSTSVR